MNPYNGFSPKQRLRALAWLKTQFAAGTRAPRPTICDACGQVEGALEWHSENYSEPFGDHIGAYGLCYTCHMMVHCRFRAPEAWAVYRDAVARGATFPANHRRNFWVVTTLYLPPGKLPEPAWREAPARLVLHEIEAGMGRPVEPMAADG